MGVFVFEECQEHHLQIKEQVPVLDVIKVMTDSLRSDRCRHEDRSLEPSR